MLLLKIMTSQRKEKVGITWVTMTDPVAGTCVLYLLYFTVYFILFIYLLFIIYLFNLFVVLM